MNRRNELQRVLLVLAVGVVGLILNANVSAQVQTDTFTTTGQPNTEVKVDRGTVVLVDGTNQAFKIPDGQKFNIDGQMVDAWGLKKGMKVSATKVTEVPETVVDQQKEITGTMPPPDPPADLPILVVVVLPVDAPAPDPVPVQTAAVAPDALPKTASQLPLIGMLGVLALLSGLALRAVRVLG